MNWHLRESVPKDSVSNIESARVWVLRWTLPLDRYFILAETSHP
jgi:hypothetical protein